VATSTFHIGEYHIGVRSSRSEVDAAITQALRLYAVDDVEAPPNLSVRIGGYEHGSANDANGKRHGSGSKHLHLLYRSSSLAARSRMPSRVVWALVSYLEGFVERTEGSPYLQTSALALVGDGGAILVPRAMLGSIEQLQPRVERHGLRFVDCPTAVLDPVSAELVVPRPALEVDEIALQGLDDNFGGSSRPELPIQHGHYPIRSWAFFGSADDHGPLSRAKAVAAGAGTAIMDGLEPQPVLDAFVNVFDSVPAESIWYSGPQLAAEVLLGLARQ
jgi:hypothetical protein